MPIRVRLSDIIDGMEMQSDEMTAYLQRPTGRVLVVSDDALQAAEDDDEDWVEPEELADARSILANESEYLALPDRFEIDEYRMMERFAAGIDDPLVRDTALEALHGAGAFRRFKDTVQRHDLAKAWYAYRDRGYAEVARTWCEINGINHDDALADA
jgi:hypothetical protein